MAMQKFTVFIHKNCGEFGRGAVALWPFDMSTSYNGKPSDYLLLGTTDVEVDVPEIDTRQMQIDALEKCINAERAESQSRINLLLDRISKLQAIGHEVGE